MIESFDWRGLLDALRHVAVTRDTAASAHPEQHRCRPGGHFAGIDFFHDEVGEKAKSCRMSGGIETLAVEMATIEPILAERAEAHGVQVRCARRSPESPGTTTSSSSIRAADGIAAVG